MNDEFVKTVIALAGDTGKKWLKELPSIVKRYEKKWDISVSSPFHLSYNYVAPAQTQNGNLVVLKISFPGNKEFVSEIEALKIFNREGAIKILRDEKENGAVLLEKAEPGSLLRALTSDTEQILIASQVIKILHKPISKEMYNVFPSITDWGKAFERYRQKFEASGPIPKYFLEKAEDMFKSSVQNNKESVLLHGDLHSNNILSSKRGWLVIDPKEVIGEPEFELAAYLRNPIYDYPKGSDYKKLETQKILQFSQELGFDKKRILGWAFAGAVISILWFLEDEDIFKEIYLQNAELLNEIKL